MKLFLSVAGFAKLGLCGIRFCESLDKYVYEFLLCILWIYDNLCPYLR